MLAEIFGGSNKFIKCECSINYSTDWISKICKQWYICNFFPWLSQLNQHSGWRKEDMKNQQYLLHMISQQKCVLFSSTTKSWNSKKQKWRNNKIWDSNMSSRHISLKLGKISRELRIWHITWNYYWATEAIHESIGKI